MPLPIGGLRTFGLRPGTLSQAPDTFSLLDAEPPIDPLLDLPKNRLGLLDEEDPMQAVILASPGLSAQTKALLRVQFREDNRKKKLSIELARLRAEREGESPGDFIATLGGFPIGLQVGTGLGVKGFPGLLMDFFLDPLFFVGGVGVFNKAGRAANNLLKGTSVTKKADMLVDTAKVLAQASGDDALALQFSRAAEFALETGNTNPLMALFKTTKGTFSPSALKKAARHPNFDPDFLRILDDPKKFRNDLVEMFSMADRDAVHILGRTRKEQFALGQRGLVNFTLPFSGFEIGSLKIDTVMDALGVRKLVNTQGFARAKRGTESLLGLKPVGRSTANRLTAQSRMVVEDIASAGTGGLRRAEEAEDIVRGVADGLDDTIKVLKEERMAISADVGRLVEGGPNAKAVHKAFVTTSDELRLAARKKGERLLPGRKGLLKPKDIKRISPTSDAAELFTRRPSVPKNRILAALAKVVGPKKAEVFATALRENPEIQELFARFTGLRELEDVFGSEAIGIRKGLGGNKAFVATPIGRAQDLADSAKVIRGSLTKIDDGRAMINTATKKAGDVATATEELKVITKTGDKVAIKAQKARVKDAREVEAKFRTAGRNLLKAEGQRIRGILSRRFDISKKAMAKIPIKTDDLLHMPTSTLEDLIGDILSNKARTIMGKSKVRTEGQKFLSTLRALPPATKIGKRPPPPDIPAALKKADDVDNTAAPPGGGVPRVASQSVKAITEAGVHAEDARVIHTVYDSAIRSLDFVTGRWTDELMKGTEGLVSKVRGWVDVTTRELMGFRNRVGEAVENLRLVAKNDKRVLDLMTRAIEHPERMAELAKYGKQYPAAAKAVKEIFDAFGSEAMRMDIIQELVQNYVTHLTEMVDPNNQKHLSQLTAQIRAWASKGKDLPGTIRARRRVFPDLESLEKFAAESGIIKVVSTGLDDVLEASMRGLGVTMLRKRTFETLQGMKIDGQFAVVLGVAKKLPGYKTIVGNLGLEQNAWVHPDIWKFVQGAWGRPWNMIPEHESAFLKTLTYLESLMKTLLVKMSPFHASSMTMGGMIHQPSILSQSALAIKKSMQAYATTFKRASASEGLMTAQANALSALSEAVVSSPLSKSIVSIQDELDRMLAAGLEIGIGEMGAHKVVDNLLGMLSRKLTQRGLQPLAEPVTGLRKLNKISDLNLWHTMQARFKVSTALHFKHRFLRANPGVSGATLRAAEREIAIHVNSVYGGHAWALMGMSPFWERTLRRFVMFPDWNVSNLKPASDMVLNTPGFIESLRLLPGPLKKMGEAGATFLLKSPLGADVFFKDLRFKMAREYMFRSTLMYLGGASIMNYAFTGRWLWDNDPDAWDDTGPFLKLPRVELPYKDKDGRKQYMDLGKQFVEPLEFAFAPIDFLKRKIGAVPRLGSIIFLGYNPGSDRPVWGFKDGPLEKELRVGQEIAQQFVPISLQQAGRIASGEANFYSAAISSVGFPVRRESIEAFNQRTRIEDLEGLLGP